MVVVVVLIIVVMSGNIQQHVVNARMHARTHARTDGRTHATFVHSGLSLISLSETRVFFCSARLELESVFAQPLWVSVCSQLKFAALSSLPQSGVSLLNLPGTWAFLRSRLLHSGIFQLGLSGTQVFLNSSLLQVFLSSASLTLGYSSAELF